MITESDYKKKETIISKRVAISSYTVSVRACISRMLHACACVRAYVHIFCLHARVRFPCAHDARLCPRVSQSLHHVLGNARAIFVLSSENSPGGDSLSFVQRCPANSDLFIIIFRNYRVNYVSYVSYLHTRRYFPAVYIDFPQLSQTTEVCRGVVFFFPRVARRCDGENHQ